jgi:AcrR family transcriptional regulator
MHRGKLADKGDAMSKAAIATKTRQQSRGELNRQSILDAASLLFIDKGFGGTNINDIADALGATRTAVYYYFQSKEAILEALTEEVTEQAGKLARSVSGYDELPPEAALRQLVMQHAMLILTHPLQFRVVERSENSLPEPRRAVARAARHSVLSHFVHVIQRGIDAGAFVAPDARTAALAIIGMCNWSAWWFEPEGTAVEPVAQALTELALRSVVRDRQRHQHPASIAESIRLLREHLDVLEEQTRQAPR